MAGYSDTALVRKLGFKPGFRIALVGAPDGFDETLGELPQGVKLLGRATKDLDAVLFFTDSRRRLEQRMPSLAKSIRPSGMVWIAWPKKASGVPTDLDFNAVQTTGLASSLVDTKICAVDETWSGLKFVVRVKDRAGR